MPRGFLDIATTPSVCRVQAAMGIADDWRGYAGSRRAAGLGVHEVGFIEARDSFYLATVSETGWPYLQHRGGEAGFLKVLDPHTLAFGDYMGNRQYISTGNLAANDRACLLLMDYVQRQRLKIYARVEILSLEQDPGLTAILTPANQRIRLERIFRLQLEAYDWNCPQHIARRYSEAEVTEAMQGLRQRIAVLQAENQQLGQRVDVRNPGADPDVGAEQS